MKGLEQRSCENATKSLKSKAVVKTVQETKEEPRASIINSGSVLIPEDQVAQISSAGKIPLVEAELMDDEGFRPQPQSRSDDYAASAAQTRKSAQASFQFFSDLGKTTLEGITGGCKALMLKGPPKLNTAETVLLEALKRAFRNNPYAMMGMLDNMEPDAYASMAINNELSALGYWIDKDAF